MVDCKNLGHPSPDKQLRLYTQAECDQLGGTYNAGETCNVKTGGSFSYDCRYLNNQESASSTSTNTSTTKLSTGVILGIIAGVVIFALLIIRGVLSLFTGSAIKTGGGKRKTSILLLGGIAVILLLASLKMF